MHCLFPFSYYWFLVAGCWILESGHIDVPYSSINEREVKKLDITYLFNSQCDLQV